MGFLCGLFYDASVARMTNGLMRDECWVEDILIQGVVTSVNKENHRKALRIAVVPAQVGYEHLCNTNHVHCRYTNPFRAFLMILRLNMLIIIFVSSIKHFDHVTDAQCVCVREDGGFTIHLHRRKQTGCLTFRRPRLRSSVPSPAALADVFELFSGLLKYGTTTVFQFYRL
jgi:hypothetical protein